LIEARNTHVITGLQKAYAEQIGIGTLQIFCISNKSYSKYTEKGYTEMVKASGIPALRKYCYSITSQKQLLEAKHFITTTIGGLLNSVRIQAQIKHSDHRNSKQLAPNINGWFEDIRTAVCDLKPFQYEIS
jgi:hypothetical protein